MAERKQTPDILSEILGGEASSTSSTAAEIPETAPKPAPRSKSPSRKPSRPTPPKAQAWEYMEIVFRDYGGYRPRFINGEEQSGWKQAPVIHEYLNQLGDQGWELVAVSSRDDMQMPAYFKRLKRS